jgi:hypothetical protein
LKRTSGVNLLTCLCWLINKLLFIILCSKAVQKRTDHSKIFVEDAYLAKTWQKDVLQNSVKYLPISRECGVAKSQAGWQIICNEFKIAGLEGSLVPGAPAVCLDAVFCGLFWPGHRKCLLAWLRLNDQMHMFKSCRKVSGLSFCLETTVYTTLHYSSLNSSFINEAKHPKEYGKDNLFQ